MVIRAKTTLLGFASIATLLLAHCVQGAEPTKPAKPKSPLELSFSVSPVRARANVPVVTKAQVTNTSKRDFDYICCMFRSNLRRFVVTRNGMRVAHTTLGESMMGGGSVTIGTFSAAESEKDEVALNRVFDMSAPGEYLVKYTYSIDWAEAGKRHFLSDALFKEVNVVIEPSPNPLVVSPIEPLNEQKKPKELQCGWHIGIKVDKRKFRPTEPIAVHITEQYWGEKPVRCFSDLEFLKYGPSVIVANLDGSVMRRTTLFNELYEIGLVGKPLNVDAKSPTTKDAPKVEANVAKVRDGGEIGADFILTPMAEMFDEVFLPRAPLTQVRATFTINQMWDMSARTSYLIWVARRLPSVDGGSILVTSEILRVDVEPAPRAPAVPK